MNYDVYLENHENETVEVRTLALHNTYPAQQGVAHYHLEGDLAMAFSEMQMEPWTDAWTGRERTDFHPCWLEGRSGAESVAGLTRAVLELGTDQRGERHGCTDGNAGLAALIMLSWALQTPEAHWSVQ